MQEYCYQCMRPLQGAAVCPHCGFDNAAAPAASEPYHLPRGTVLNRRYLVGNVIGEGGFGITYIGLDATLSKRIAIKEFFPSGVVNRTNTVSGEVLVTQGKEDFFGRGVERFLYEAKNIAAFSEEEGIVYVLDYFQANGTAYIVMEYLDGETLKDHVNRYGRFMPEQLIALMLPVMRSLAAMHAEGIIHRDISPDNIMYTKRGKLKLMDFGSARYYTGAERQMSVILKQGFAPEEQYRQTGKQGPFTDVYALCATIYACITATVPVSSLDRLVNDTLPAPSQLGVRMQPYQERALLHGMAVNKDNRTPNMDALIRELTDPAAAPQGMAWQQPVQPAQWQQPAPQPPQKSKAPLIVALVAAVVLIGTGIVAGILLLGGGRDRQDDTQSSLYISENSASGSVPDDSSHSSSDNGESRQPNTSYDSSAAPSTSTAESSSVSSVPAQAHVLTDENGEYIIEDERIDTGDVRAEQRLRESVIIDGSEVSSDKYTFSYFISGNTLVYQYRYTIELTDEQISALPTTAATLKTNAEARSYKKNLQTEAGVDNPQICYVYYTVDGDVITAVMVDD